MESKDIRQYKRLQLRATAARGNLERFRKSLAQSCDHPADFVVDFEWEHDNGYGRQHMRRGKLCQICFKQDRWNDGRWYAREAFRE